VGGKCGVDSTGSGQGLVAGSCEYSDKSWKLEEQESNASKRKQKVVT